MENRVLYVGLDVDDAAFHGAIFDPIRNALRTFKCRPTVKGLADQLERHSKLHPDASIRICYEATYLGFSLQRKVAAAGYHCDVIAPNSIPRVRGNQIKTDRVDAEKLARFYATNQLTIVAPPEESQERDRDVLRSRQFILHQLAEIRSHIQSLLRRAGLHYKAETGNKSHWTCHHLCWLERQAESTEGSFQTNLTLLLQQMKAMGLTLKEYDQQVEELAQSKTYRERVQALVCYKGIKNVFALTMILEIGDIRRFVHPRKLVSYIGMDIREHSSGGTHHRFGITKHGNRFLRTAFVEANQRAFRTTRLGKDLKSRRKPIRPEYIQIADRCLKRLSKKGNRLLRAGKHHNKVKVACAREMVGFVWESLLAASKAS